MHHAISLETMSENDPASRSGSSEGPSDERSNSPSGGAGPDDEGHADSDIAVSEPESETGSKRLYIIEYGSENERKRAEYALKNWEDAEVERPNGTIRIVETEDQSGLMNRLISTVPYDHIRAFDLRDVEVSENVETVSLERTISASREGVETTLEFMLSQRSGALIDPSENKYEVDEKGPAEVSYKFLDTSEPDRTEIRITIEGAPQTTQHLYNTFREELDQFEQKRSGR